MYSQFDFVSFCVGDGWLFVFARQPSISELIRPTTRPFRSPCPSALSAYGTSTCARVSAANAHAYLFENVSMRATKMRPTFSGHLHSITNLQKKVSKLQFLCALPALFLLQCRPSIGEQANHTNEMNFHFICTRIRVIPAVYPPVRARV